MQEILHLDHHRVVTLIGAGGKSTTMYYLANEMARSGKHILVTTTTKILYKMADADRFVEGTDWDRWFDLLRTRRRAGDFLVAGVGTGNGKILGVLPEWIDRLQETRLFDLILVEGDGAARRSMKAPAEYEPIVPVSTTLLLPVMGMRCMGQPLSGEIVHRPERFAALAGIREGEAVRAEHYARVFCHPNGYHLTAHQPLRQVIPILNQVDTPYRERCAAKLARQLLREGIEMVLLTSYRYPNPIRRVFR